MKTLLNPFLVIGAGGHSRVVIDSLERSYCNIAGIVDTNYSGKKESIMGYPVLGGTYVIDNYDLSDINIAVAIGNNEEREEIFNRLLLKGYNLPKIIDSTSIISRSALIDKGTYINAGAIINSCSTIGKNVIINTGSIIEHEVEIGDHTHIGPGVKIAGRVKIGKNSFIGIGSIIIQKIEIGEKAIIGAGTVVLSNVEPGSTFVGIPGKKK